MNIWTLSLLNALSELYSPPLAEHSVIYYCRLHWLIHALVLWENLTVLTWQSISTPTLWWHHTLMRKTAVSMAKWERCHYWAGVVQMDCSLPQPHPLVGFSYRSEFNFCRDAGNKWLLKKKKKSRMAERRQGALWEPGWLCAVLFSYFPSFTLPWRLALQKRVHFYSRFFEKCSDFEVGKVNVTRPLFHPEYE